MPEFFANLIKLPVLVRLRGRPGDRDPRRPAGPPRRWRCSSPGSVTFVLIGIAGASAIERYLAVAAVALLVFAAVAFGGFTLLEPGRAAHAPGWSPRSRVIVFGVAFTATRLNLARFDAELSFRGAAHDDLAEVLADPRVRAGLKCGPLTTPNHKLVPDTRWIADLPYEKVRARADPKLKMPRKGVAIYVNSRFARCSRRRSRATPTRS